MCAQIAGLQDFRQEGPPADIGNFQFQCSVMVFQYTFSGTTYICAIRSGVRGWTLVDYGTVAGTVINSAVSVGGEIFVKAGTYNLTVRILIAIAKTSLVGEGPSTIFFVTTGAYINAIEVTADYCTVKSLAINGNRTNNPPQGNEFIQNGIYVFQASYAWIEDIYVKSCPYRGIQLGSRLNGYSTVTQCISEDNGDYGIICYYYSNATLIGNRCLHSATAHGINIFESYGCIVIDNRCEKNKWDGIFIDSTDYGTGNNNIIANNICCNNGYGTAASRDGIRLVTTDFNIITGNRCFDDQTPKTQRYGINISNNTCNKNLVYGNYLTDNATGALNDAGTDTMLPTVRACFIKELGTAAWITTAAAPMGIDIDAANEGALAKIKLPADLQQVVRIKVFGIAQVAEVDGMQLLIAAGSGIDNETWNAEAINVASKTSSTLNFANLDVIQWVFTSADDADIGHLTAGDFLQWCCYFAAVSGVNCATDLLLAGEGLEIQYV